MATEHSIFSEALTSAFFDQVFSPKKPLPLLTQKPFAVQRLFFWLNKLPGDSKARRQEGFSDNSGVLKMSAHPEAQAEHAFL